MFKQFFANMESITLPLVAMFLFAGTFVLILARTFGYQQKSDFDSVASLPLTDDCKEIKS